MHPKTGVVTLFTVCAFLKLTVEGTSNQSPFAPECQAWKNLTDRMTRVEQLNVTCAVNPPCTGFECNGIFELAGRVSESFRFGMSFLPCTDPLTFDVVADMRDYPLNFTLAVGKNQTINESIPVPGGTRSYGMFKVETNLTILLISAVSSNGLQLITIETNVTIKIIPTWMQSFVIIPRVTLPFPYCSGTPSVFGEPQTTSQAPDLEWTGSKCTQFSMKDGCEGENQMCTSSGRCACISGLFWHEDIKQCNNVTKPADSTSSKPDAWIIVAATISAAVVIIGILIMIVYKYRRYQERYGQHSLLVDRENDTELDDPDPPMLPA